MSDIDYSKIGFKAGVEIHNRLATKNKLFCSDSPVLGESVPSTNVRRKLRTVPGELGEIDPAALFEQLKGKTFTYNLYPNSCAVETDEEPPHPLNQEALLIAIAVAKLVNAQIPDEIHVMRKIVIDGSNTGGFQRTALIGMNGVLKTTKGPVRISNISVEEESAGIVDQRASETIYRLDRLGIPLIEIGTEADIKDPEHAREVAEKLGMMVRSTGKSQRGIGVTRQDLNVSIRGGARVEIKGFQELDLIPKVLEAEVKRQLELVRDGKKAQPETRLAKADGTTEFMRPLPGAGRMYPETDIPPIPITRELLSQVIVPEKWEDKLLRFKKIMPADLSEQVLKSEYLPLFEKLAKAYDPVLVATILVSTITELRRRGAPTDNLIDSHVEGVLMAVKSGRTAKESIPRLLELLASRPELTAGEAIAQLGTAAITEAQLRNITLKVFREWPQLVAEKKTSALMGEVMKEVRGRSDGKTVARVMQEELARA